MLSSGSRNFDNPLSPEEVHFIDLKVEPWEDKSKIKIFVKISQFLVSPNMNFYIKNLEAAILSEVTLIENIDTDLVFTMHLRNYSSQKELILLGEIFYDNEIGLVNQKSLTFSL